MARRDSIANRLYRGDVSYDFVGRRRRWYLISGAIVVLSLLSLLTRPLHLGIDFKGGAVFELPSNGKPTSVATQTLQQQGLDVQIVQSVGTTRVRVQTAAASAPKANQAAEALATAYGVPRAEVSVSTVGPTWGGQITSKALQGLGLFLLFVLIYLSFRFEWRMAAAAFVALIHDLVVTAGVYSLVGFEVTPATLIAVLTILGYSLYDTVVVFDKVQENTATLTTGSRMTYSAAANLAVNQTLVRSINTSIISLLPVSSIFFIGYFVLGAGTLKDLSLALLVGLFAGTYSSIFIATPLVVDLKERQPEYAALRKRVEARQASEAARAPAPVAAGAVDRPVADAGGAAALPGGPAPVRPPRPHRQNRPSGAKGRPGGRR